MDIYNAKDKNKTADGWTDETLQHFCIFPIDEIQQRETKLMVGPTKRYNTFVSSPSTKFSNAKQSMNNVFFLFSA